MVMPYRKSFYSGASGPMTEAISQGIPCLFPRYGSWGNYGMKYQIGNMFEVENPKSLAEGIEKMVAGEFIFDKSIIEQLSTKAFVDNHKQIYNSIFD
jgi:hypothetical protein